MSGYKYRLLFSMIPICNWVIDELHLLLRIFDRLWNLILSELRSTHCFNDQIHQVIISEMKRIRVQFYFREDQNTKTWLFTTLSGNDRLKVLRDFDLNVIFTPERAAKIRELWNGFNNLYDDTYT